jgi:hypothetical protein
MSVLSRKVESFLSQWSGRVGTAPGIEAQVRLNHVVDTETGDEDLLVFAGACLRQPLPTPAIVVFCLACESRGPDAESLGEQVSFPTEHDGVPVVYILDIQFELCQEE